MLDNKIIYTASQLKDVELKAPASSTPLTAATVNRQNPFAPQQLILLFSANDWEIFISEWAHYQRKKYNLVAQLGGSNDYGVDVACFATDDGFLGDWDNYQCKHYASALTPGDAIPEIGKFLWHIYNKRLTTPSNYYFFSPKDVGPSLKKLLLNSPSLKKKLKIEWVNWCSKSITSTDTIHLTGNFLDFVDTFDFSIFKYKPHLDVISEHRDTPYYVERFGGGLKDRPLSQKPPTSPENLESRYIEQLYEAYSDNKSKEIKPTNIDQYPSLNDHLGRSRETFYEAESLRLFARDSIPTGTYEHLQDQVYFGVKDVEDDEHPDGLKRVKEVVKTATQLNLNASGLIGVIEVKDLQGICHQLANNNRLIWKK